MDYRVIITSIFVSFALLELAFGRFFFREQTTRKDLILDIGAGLGLPVLALPAVMWAATSLSELAMPEARDALAHWPALAMLGVLLLADDLTQYGWHRLSHSYAPLYRLHRAHHSAEYLSVRLVYRNNILYYLMMPGLWFSSVLLYLGFGKIYAAYYIVKMTVIIAAHSSVPWDAKLLQVPWLRPLMWVLARTISTPATHAAHHGKHADDGVTYYKGNYGNLLFLWDVLFGTAKISKERPAAYGLENIEPATWQQELLWPFGPPPELEPEQLADAPSPALQAAGGERG